MKASETENRFETGLQQPKYGLRKTTINIPSCRSVSLNQLKHYMTPHEMDLFVLRPSVEQWHSLLDVQKSRRVPW